MNSIQPDINYLWLQFVQNKASWQELQELLHYLQQHPDHSYDVALLEEYLAANPPVISPEDQQVWTGKLQQFWESQGVTPITARKRNLRMYIRWTAAASIIAIAALISFYLVRKQPDTSKKDTSDIASINKVSPGLTKGAILTLADGRQIALDSAGNGLITQQDGTSILLKDQQLIYSSQQSSASASINTLSTPRGRQFTVELPDGSRAWLNAASSLTYPTAFNKDRREVQVTGEVYFEIAKGTRDAKTSTAIPFIVKTARQTIEVLGTAFNVNCYEEEDAEKTTLVEGRVRVSSSHTNGILLQPGQQAIVTASGEAITQQANIAAVTDWKTGKFIFNNDNIQIIMRKISRLYDMEVVYKNINNTTNKNFVGSVNRFHDVNELLRKLELTGTVRFTVEGRKIIVMP